MTLSIGPSDKPYLIQRLEFDVVTGRYRVTLYNYSTLTITGDPEHSVPSAADLDGTVCDLLGYELTSDVVGSKGEYEIPSVVEVTLRRLSKEGIPGSKPRLWVPEKDHMGLPFLIQDILRDESCLLVLLYTEEDCIIPFSFRDEAINALPGTLDWQVLNYLGATTQESRAELAKSVGFPSPAVARFVEEETEKDRAAELATKEKVIYE